MSNFSVDIFIYKYSYHQFNTAESKHFNITGSVLQLTSQLRKHCQSKQQPLRGEISKILGKRGEPSIKGLCISWGNYP